jgi:hypothetical protein
MQKIILGLLISLGLWQNAMAQSFDATVNRTVVPSGETFVLTLDLKDVDTSSTPDFTPLAQDFTTLSISNGYRTSIINGRVSKSRQWNLVMIPNHEGEIEIPSITLDKFQTKPITLKIVSPEEQNKLVTSKAAETPQYKMTTKADTLSPYVGQQLNYRVTIYDAGGLQGEMPNFITDNQDDWIIKSLGEPKVTTNIVNGQAQREITFDYALFAQKSGKLTIPPVRFNGYYLSKNSRTDPFADLFGNNDILADFGFQDVFAGRNPVVLTAKPQPVDVLPAPQQANGWWLPASDVRLTAEFDKNPPEFKTGEATIRTIVLQAVGVLDNQLPNLKMPNIDGIKQYPEKPQTSMRLENGKVVSELKLANVYIPSVKGDNVLPPLQVKWFNTQTSQFETAQLPAYPIRIEGTEEAEQAVAAPISAPVAEKQAAQPVTQNTSVEVVNQVNNLQIGLLLAAAFVGGILLALLLMAFYKWLGTKSSSMRQQVIKNAKKGDLTGLQTALLQWAVLNFPQRKITNLQEVSEAASSDKFKLALDKLSRALYSENNASQDWKPQDFLSAFDEVCKRLKKTRRTEDGPLPKLYR